MSGEVQIWMDNVRKFIHLVVAEDNAFNGCSKLVMWIVVVEVILCVCG